MSKLAVWISTLTVAALPLLAGGIATSPVAGGMRASPDARAHMVQHLNELRSMPPPATRALAALDAALLGACVEVPRGYRSALAELKSKNAWRASVHTITHMLRHSPDAVSAEHFTLAINTCGAAGRWEAAIALLEALFKHSERGGSASVDLQCVNSAIAACAACPGRSCEAHECALRIMRESIPRAGLRADTYSYANVLHALSRAGDSAAALELFCEMPRHGVRPNLHVYATLIAALGRDGRHDEALGVWDAALADANVAPDAVCYGAAINSAIGAKRPGRALEIFDSMRVAGVVPDEGCYNGAFRACRLQRAKGAAASAGESCATTERCRRLLAQMPRTQCRDGFNAALDFFTGTADGPAIFADAIDAGAIRSIARYRPAWAERNLPPAYELDLHGLSAGAAREAVGWWASQVKGRLRAQLRRGETPALRLITGKGNSRTPWQRSSRKQDERVRGSVAALLTEHGATLLPSRNKGVLLVEADWLVDCDSLGGGVPGGAQEAVERELERLKRGSSSGGGAQAELDARMWTTDGRAARGDAHSNSLGAQLKRLQDKRQSEFQSDDASQGGTSRSQRRSASNLQWRSHRPA